jgi:hypothetical protein
MGNFPKWEDVDWRAVHASRVFVGRVDKRGSYWEVSYIPNHPYDRPWSCHWLNSKKQSGGAQSWETIKQMAEYTEMPQQLRVECENFVTASVQHECRQTDFLAQLGLEV